MEGNAMARGRSRPSGSAPGFQCFRRNTASGTLRAHTWGLGGPLLVNCLRSRIKKSRARRRQLLLRMGTVGCCGVFQQELRGVVGYQSARLFVFALRATDVAIFFRTGLINSSFCGLDVFVCCLSIQPHSGSNFGETKFVLEFQ
jgi:hypothetical protein